MNNEMYTPEWCEEKKSKTEQILLDLAKGSVKIYSPQDEPDHTRRRLFEVGVEMAQAACDFERCSFMDMTKYLNVMERVYALCGGKDYSTTPDIALYKAGTERGWRVEVNGQVLFYTKEVPDILNLPQLDDPYRGFIEL